MTATKSTFIRQHGYIKRFIGDDARIADAEQVPVNNCITGEWLEIAAPEDNQPEEKGMIYMQPTGVAGRYILQVCYLYYPDQASENPVVFSLQFLPSFFDHYPAGALAESLSNDTAKTSEHQFAVCAAARALLTALQQEDEVEEMPVFEKLLRYAEAAMQLLRRAIGGIIATPVTTAQVPACRFLAYDAEREKIDEALAIIARHIDSPQTIRELSRKVGMNECYLKKGFKAVTGQTIHEYQQEQRINKAKELLKDPGMSVTDVANTLGYSSISHFSTAFKRVTGMKPCELLS